jgi:hypothetical protein
VAQHRMEHIEEIRAYDRRRYREVDHRREQVILWNRAGIADPVRRSAWSAVSNAIKSGRLVRPAFCSECGAECRPDAHHDDYTKPITVRWLCRPCHIRHHCLTGS